MRLPPPATEAQALAELKAHRGPQPGAQELHRPGLPRHAHAGRHPAQHPREPGLVHRLHALPGRDLAGPHGSAGELPDHGLRPHRHGHRQCQHAGRSHGRSRSDDAGQAQRARQGPDAARRRRRAPADARGAEDPRRAAGAVGQGGRLGAGLAGRAGWRRLFRRAGPVPRQQRLAARLDGRCRCRACQAGRLHRGRRPAGADPAQATGRDGRRHWSAARSALACPWAPAARTPPTWPAATNGSAACRAAWWASASIRTAPRPTGWRCRRASSTSAAKRPPATSARPRCCRRWWPACTPSTTGRKG
jgi:hypothetical protein